MRWSYPSAASIKSNPFSPVFLTSKIYGSMGPSALFDARRTPVGKSATIAVKKRHTHNNRLLTDASRRVLALSPTQPGARHDYGLLKAWDFPQRLPPDVVCWTDLGFQGMKKDFPHLSIIQLKKKPKGRPLDAVDRFINTQKSRIRIRVEHAIGGVKRLAAVAQTYRNHTPKMEDQLMVVACALWNFYLKCTI